MGCSHDSNIQVKHERMQLARSKTIKDQLEEKYLEYMNMIDKNGKIVFEKFTLWYIIFDYFPAPELLNVRLVSK
jgi:hypothetical protein